MNSLENIILQKLSFFMAMNKAQILITIDDVELQEIGHLDLQSLEETLCLLRKKGKIKTLMKNDQQLYIRINPGVISWYKKIYYELNYYITRIFKK